MEIKIALAGNPNCGKTTLFNALTGSNQFVGNWPGVTVEKKEGKLKKHKDVTIMDLPGIYSLSPYTLEEVVARNYLVGERPDAILNIIDGTNLERNLYLTTQLAEIGIPMVIAVNMIDIIRKNGDKIDIKKLSEELGFPVYEISALKGISTKEVADHAVRMAKKRKKAMPKHSFKGSVEHAIAHIEEVALHSMPEEQQRWFAIKLFERDEKVYDQLSISPELRKHIETDIKNCEDEMDDDSESIITSSRYDYITSIINKCLFKKDKDRISLSDKIDRVVTHRVMALPIFAAVIFAVYYVSVSTLGAFLTDWTNETLFGERIMPAVSTLLEATESAQWLNGLLVDGIIAGIGAVLGFVPQMLVLFIFLAFLEACGYMARIAFIMDRIFRKFGLSGKSFIPMLIGTGCSVPGIMASRTIENDRDRKMTVITTSFIPCGAKLPIIALIAGALFDGAWWVAPSAYFAGIAAIICSGIILKKTKMFAGDPAPFVMELPSYHWPATSNVLRSAWERGWSFIKKAGTIILLSTIVVWFTSYFGWINGKFVMLDDMQMENSILAYIGAAVTWLFVPLGWGHWKAAVASVTGLVAKENIVGTFGILYGFSRVAEDGSEIWISLQGSFTPIAAYSFLIFNLLCAPCFAAVGAIKREMNSGKWTWFAVGYQSLLAYSVSLCVYQFGRLINGEPAGIWTFTAVLIVILLAYMMIRPDKRKRFFGKEIKNPV